jgi:hypothetical protein
VVGRPVLAVIAAFTDNRTDRALGKYSATIDWGDGSGPTAGTVTQVGLTYRVSGGHTFQHAGTYRVRVTVTATDGRTAVAEAGLSRVFHRDGMASSLAAADFDGNGFTDLATSRALYGPDTAHTVLSGSGDGTFAGEFPLADGTIRGHSLVAADFDGDGHADLGSADWGTEVSRPKLRVHFGNGDGTFDEESFTLDAPNTDFVATADVNADGLADLLADYGTGLMVLLGSPGRVLTQVYTEVNPDGDARSHPLAVADFNGDGKPDVALWVDDTRLAVLRGVGDGTFAPALFTNASRILRLRAGDFDGDGRTDFAVVEPSRTSSSTSVRVYRGNGDGTFGVAQTVFQLAAGGIQDIQAADVDADGRSDLLVMGGTLRLLLASDAPGGFQPPIRLDATNLPSRLGTLAPADFNGDGLPDLAAAAEPLGSRGYASGVEVFVNTLLRVAAAPQPPRVQQVYVRGSTWAPALLGYLRSNEMGSADFGFAVGGGAAQLKPLPWRDVDTVSITFDRDVEVGRDDLSVGGVRVVSYGVSGFAYDAGARTATWTLARPIRDDAVTIDLDADAGGVRAGGAALDGEWAGGGDDYPSGDGAPGGDFRFRLNVLPGDVNRDGRVNVRDFQDVRRRLFRTAAAPGTGAFAYTAFHDVTGDGRIGVTDLAAARAGHLRTLPTAPPPGIQRPLAAPREEVLGALPG